MALHHRIRPHHHVATWSVMVLGVILSAISYTNATLAEEREYHEDQPSERTQEFFGGKAKEQTGSLPEECKVEQQQYSTPQSSPPPDTANTDGRPRIGKEEYDKLTEEQKAALAPDTVIEDRTQVTSSSPVNADSEQYKNLSEEQKKTMTEQPNGGPSGDMFGSPDCQKAMIKQIKGEMAEFRDEMRGGEFDAKLRNMLEVIAKLETNGLQTLKEAGVDTSKIEPLFGPIKEDANTLMAFFKDMLAAMDKFFTIEEPTEAFKYMRDGFPHDKMGSMAKVADRLVDNILVLKEELEKISKTLAVSPSPEAEDKAEQETAEGATSGQ